MTPPPCHPPPFPSPSLFLSPSPSSLLSSALSKALEPHPNDPLCFIANFDLCDNQVKIIVMMQPHINPFTKL